MGIPFSRPPATVTSSTRHNSHLHPGGHTLLTLLRDGDCVSDPCGEGDLMGVAGPADPRAEGGPDPPLVGDDEDAPPTMPYRGGSEVLDFSVDFCGVEDDDDGCEAADCGCVFCVVAVDEGCDDDVDGLECSWDTSGCGAVGCFSGDIGSAMDVTSPPRSCIHCSIISRTSAMIKV